MDLALTVLLLWGLLFVPVGIVLQWAVLGEGSRVRALPIAPITGIATAILVLSVLGRVGIDPSASWVPPAWALVSVACAVWIWRRKLEWRRRELIGTIALVLFATVLMQLPVIGAEGDGPLGYGTAQDPVTEVAAIDAAADGAAGKLEVARSAAATADERPIGFEQFAALTVAIGTGDDGSARTGTALPSAQDWSAYGLHSTITGLLAVLIVLPLGAFARARGVKWFGLAVLVPLGVLAPATFLALANGAGAAVASLPLTTAAIFSLLVTRRDRGWWALVVLFGAAVAATAGPIALMPLLFVGTSWMLVRSTTYEHLSQLDTPVARPRTLVVTIAAAVLGLLACLPTLLNGGSMLAWRELHASWWDAVRSWPFAWLDTDLSTAGPDGPLETAIWLIGPALLAVALIYAVTRNERRELGVLVGSVVAALAAALLGVADRTASIRLFEFTMLATSPFLAALAIRAVALAREHAEELRGTPAGRFAGVGPTGLVLVFVLLSFSATAVIGTRMVHAPAISAPATSGFGRTLLAAGDPWLAFVVDGERVRGGYADADAVSETRSDFAERGARAEGYDSLVLSDSPLASDPSLRYLESGALDRYQTRLFQDRVNHPDITRDKDIDPARFAQRLSAQTAGGGANVPEADEPADTKPADVPYELATAHHPLEGDGRNTPADRPAGLLLPAGDVVGCEENRDVLSGDPCAPKEPLLGDGCSDEDVAAVRSPLDADAPRASRTPSGRTPELTIAVDDLLPETGKLKLLGVQCFDVPLERDATTLLVHLRDVGVILAPERADDAGAAGWSTTRDTHRIGGHDGIAGGTRRTTSLRGAKLTYGNGRLIGNYDLVLEGSFGAGVTIATDLTVGVGADPAAAKQSSALADVQGSADGFGNMVRAAGLLDSVSVENSSGTDIALGRLFARPRDLPRSCDMPIQLAPGTLREVRVDTDDSIDAAAEVRPGLTLSVVGITGSGSSRVAHVAMGSYLSHNGMTRYSLVDWTEQYEGSVQIEGCDGIVSTEGSDDAARIDPTLVDPGDLAAALGDRADAIRAAK